MIECSPLEKYYVEKLKYSSFAYTFMCPVRSAKKPKDLPVIKNIVNCVYFLVLISS